ncbi:hypothetical protein OF83DRAFT_1080240 [Amylostereum chailletii]|nr:hypothetical protein OF83DRAFT_1080240 [Amylostereum chailletii]
MYIKRYSDSFESHEDSCEDSFTKIRGSTWTQINSHAVTFRGPFALEFGVQRVKHYMARVTRAQSPDNSKCRPIGGLEERGGQPESDRNISSKESGTEGEGCVGPRLKDLNEADWTPPSPRTYPIPNSFAIEQQRVKDRPAASRALVRVEPRRQRSRIFASERFPFIVLTP